MINKKIEQIVNSRKLPKDELDIFWDNLFGFIPATLILIAGFGPWISKKTTMSAEIMWTFLVLGLIIFSYTVFAKLTERYLKYIQTGLEKDENEKLILDMAKKEKWKKMTNKDYYHEFIFPFVKFHSGFKLTLIPTDKGILVNLRNRGTVQARMPYQFGIETIKQKKIENKIKNYAQHTI